MFREKGSGNGVVALFILAMLWFLLVYLIFN